MRGATGVALPLLVLHPISIHAPRAGRDSFCNSARTGSTDFNPRAPCGARHHISGLYEIGRHFNPRAPCGARRSNVAYLAGSTDFNPRAPCGARPYPYPAPPPPPPISIHAPRAGRDPQPAGAVPGTAISIHAPRAGRDQCRLHAGCRRKDFNPRAPCGARHPNTVWLPVSDVISIHAPRAGRDGGGRPDPIFFTIISIHAPRAGRDSRPARAIEVIRYFNPRAPCGARLPSSPCYTSHQYFNPRAPCGARPSLARMYFDNSQFQSTRPVRGATALIPST